MADARDMDRLFGIDLAVLRGSAAHDTSPLDLIEAPRPPRRGAAARDLVDLERISGRHNLAQALILRLLTPRGSLAALGHADYGSRLHELIGRRKTESTRHLCKAYVLEAVAQEPRVEPKAAAFAFDPASESPSSLQFMLAVRPRAGGDDVRFSLEIGL